MSADVMEDQPALKRAKYGSSTSKLFPYAPGPNFDVEGADDDLEAFSELDALTNDQHSSMSNGAVSSVSSFPFFS